MAPHEMLRRGAEIVTQYLGTNADDRILSVLPFSFGYGLNQLTSSILNRAALALQRIVMPSAIAEAVVTWEITALPLVAPSWVQLIRFLLDDEQTLPTVRYATSAGGATPLPTLKAMPACLPNAEISLMYGLTEGFRSTYLPSHLFHSKMGAIGQAVPNVEIFVVNHETGICGPDEVGELIHRGDLISRGYWQRPEDTAKCIRVNEYLRPLIGEEKVLHTGDLVRRDEDGILWYVGRNDGIIKTSGHRVSPSEVELAASEIPGVSAAVAFGLADNDLGQIIILVLESSNGITDLEVISVLRSQLPAYMVPRRLFFWDAAMPRISSGKIDRVTVIDEITRKLNDSIEG